METVTGKCDVCGTIALVRTGTRSQICAYCLGRYEEMRTDGVS